MHALTFLSSLPVKINNFESAKLTRSLAYFPVVGLLFGLILVGINKLLLMILPLQVANVGLIIALIILDRGLHLDGLADTADGLFGGKDKEDTLRIMKDSSIGAFGITAIAIVILSQFSLLNALTMAHKAMALIFMAAASRYSVVITNSLFKHAKTGGLGTTFASHKITSLALASFFMAVIAAALIVLKSEILPMILLSFALMPVIPLLLTRKIGGITGDIFGATIEINQVIILLFSVILL